MASKLSVRDLSLVRGLVLAYAGVLLGAVCLDWWVLLGGEQCWGKAASFAKLALVTACAVFVWTAGKGVLNRKDGIRLKIAFVVIFAGDFCFFMDWDPAALVCFVFAQVLLFIRNGRGFAKLFSRDRAALRRRMVIVSLVVFAVNAALVVGVFLPLSKDVPVPMRALGAGYSVFLCVSVIAGWGSLMAGEFPHFNARLIAAGMTLFYLCDITVGLGGIVADEWLGQAVRGVTWVFYGPALLLIALSGRGSSTKKGAESQRY